MKLVRRREVWVLTAPGAALAVLLSAVLLFAAGASLFPFLAQNEPLPDADIAIIEGWIPDTELVALLNEAPPDTLFVTTGGPIDFGSSFFEQQTYAELTADRLIELGVRPDAVLTAPARRVASDRTYAAAIAARNALDAQGLLGRPANIYSLGAHARRSFLLYRFAFKSAGPLGIVSLENARYDLRHWWRSSLAFKNMLTELTAWAYTQCTRWKYD